MKRLDCWPLRRLVVRLCGQGPRSIGSVLDAAPPVVSEPGGVFRAPAPGLSVTPDLPGDVADWPHVTQAAPAVALHVLGEAALYDDDGAIYDLRTRRAFVETLHHWSAPPHRHPALALPFVKPARRLEGLSLFMGGLGGQTFYHFLIDHLPRLSLLSRLYPEARRIIVQDYIADNKTAWLRHAGCDLPVEWLRPLDHLHCERLAFTTHPNHLYAASPWSLASLLRLSGAGAARPSRSRHIWASRLGTAARATPWEQDLICLLPPPWEVVDFGALSPAETIETMAGCTALAGLHGAAFANIALAPAGLRVLEVFSAPNHAWYPTISTLTGHKHRVLFAASSEPVLAALSSLSP
ncbi:MAG: glycosyltransferase family 61 protein [Burkholderiales bacterium]|nr:glycosyltransferase family 61 protein [Opitutaceae bacterium]